MADVAIQTQNRQPSQAQAQAQRGRRTNRKRGGDSGRGAAKADGSKPGRTAPSTKKEEAEKVVKEEVKPAVEVDESRLCWICAEPAKYYSVSECNHRTCHVCALRLRALYKKMDCTFCKEPQPAVIFTESADRPFSSYTPEEIPHKDSKLSIYFETEEMMEETLVLLRFNCPDPDCDYTASGWNDLKLHARGQHGKLMCDLCIRHKKVFSHEHALYSPSQLALHLPSMPQRHGQKQVTSDKVEGGIHPYCEFCRDCFFGDDELYSHMRERHEECFVCKRNEVRDQYFKNYEALEKHFDHAHHPCPNSSCQARKFVVFGSLLDLQAHMVEEHGAEMTPRDKKIAQRVDAGFGFQESAAGRRRGPREREPPPHTNRRDRFGGHLTTDGGAITTPSSAGPSRRQSPSPPPVDMDPVTFERQNALYTRLRALASNPTNAIAAVKLSLRSYVASESAASDLISTVWNILDRDLDNTASVVNLLVDLVDDEEKKTLLLGAWNGFKIEQRRQFPDLIPTAQGNNYAGVTGGRVLNIKQSTATRSSRRPSRAVWDRVAQAASSAGPSTPSPPPPERFPTLQPSAPSVTAGHRQPRSTTAWSASASGHAPPAPRSVPAAKPSTQPAAPKLSSSLFPELPSASSQRARPVAGGKTSLQKILGSSAPATSAWAPGASGGTSADTAVQEAPNGNIPETVGKKKGKGKQKQTLFTLGSFPT